MRYTDRGGIYRYMPFGRVARYLAAGWMEVSGLNPEYAVLMWHCNCGQADPDK